MYSEIANNEEWIIEWRIDDWQPSLQLHCMWNENTALHFFHALFCYNLIPKCIQWFSFPQDSAHNSPQWQCEKSFANALKDKETLTTTVRNDMYPSIQNLCHEAHHGAQMLHVSTDHPWDVPAASLGSTCGEFNWFDNIWKGTNLSIWQRSKEVPVDPRDRNACCLEGANDHSDRHHPPVVDVQNQQDSS